MMTPQAPSARFRLPAPSVSRYGFVTLFAALTILPVLDMALGIRVVEPVDENRTLAKPPVWTWPPRPIAWSVEADRWFNDHFGLRSFLIRLKSQIDYSVFRTSNRVHIGSDGWLFYRTVMDVEKPAVEDFLRAGEPDVIAGVEAFSDALRSKGIHLLIVPNLLADRFVADKLPDTVPHLPSPLRFDHFLASLVAIPTLDYVDTPAILRQTQKTRQIFHKTDFHWNDPAAFEVGRELVDRIAAIDGNGHAVWSHHLSIAVHYISGGIARFMPLFSPPGENALFVEKNWIEPGGRREFLNQGPFEEVIHYEPGQDLLPSTVIVGDSFFDGILRSGFDCYFQDLYRIRWTGTTKLSEIAAALPADTRFVIVQFIEVSQTAMRAFANRADVAAAVAILQKR